MRYLSSSETLVISTSSSDTFTGAAGTLGVTDTITDSNATDADVLNLTLTGAGAAARISNIETVNVSWNSFSAAALDATNISGANIVFSTTKPVFTAGTTITKLGANNLDMGTVMAGTLDVDSVTTATVKAGNATTVTSNDGTITNATFIANNASAVTLDGKASTATTNVANVTLGKSATLDSSDIGTVNLTTTAAATVTLTGSTAIDTLSVAGTGDVVLSVAELLDGSTITNTKTSGTLRADIGNFATLDASGWANTVNIKATNTGLNEITVASGATVELDVADTIAITGVSSSAATNTVSVTMDTNQTSVTLSKFISSNLSMTSGGSALTIGTLVTGGNSTMNVSGDTNATTSDGVTDLTITTLTGGTKSFTLTGTGDVVLASPTAGTIDASGLTGEFTITNSINTTADTIVKGSSGVNDVTFNTRTGDATFIGKDGDTTLDAPDLAGNASDDANFTATTGAGDDTITADVTALKYANINVTTGAGIDTLEVTGATTNVAVTVDMGDGDDTVTANSITTSSLSGAFGAGNDTLSVTGLTTGSVDVDMGDGTDSITFGGTTTLTTNASLNASLGAGNDTVTISETGALDADVNLVIDGGAGSADKVIFKSTDASAANLSLTNVEIIAIEAGVDTDFSVAQMSGKSYTLQSTASGTGTITVKDATNAGVSVDLSGLSMTDSAATGVTDVTITIGNGVNSVVGTDVSTTTDTITTGTGNDTINAKDGDDFIDAGTGADLITGGAGADTIFFDTNDSGITAATADSVVDFVSGTDKLQFTASSSAAATGSNYSEASMAVADFAAALAAANTALDTIVKFNLQFVISGGVTTGYLFADEGGTGNAVSVIKLVGIDNTDFAAGDIYV